MDPVTMSVVAPAIGGLVGGLFGGSGSEMSPEMKRLLQLMLREYKSMKAYGNSPGLSDPQEQQALASARAQALQSYMNQSGNALMGAFGGAGDQQNPEALGDFMRGVTGTQMGINSNIYNSLLMNSLDARRNVKYQQAPQMLQGAFYGAAQAPRQQTGTDLSGLFMQLGSAFGGAKKPTAPSTGLAGPGTQMGGMSPVAPAPSLFTNAPVAGGSLAPPIAFSMPPRLNPSNPWM